MKFLLLLTLVVTPAFASLDRGALIDAIGIIETGNRYEYGAHGETGPYQLTSAVRHIVRGDDRAAALRWLDVLCHRLQDNHVDVNPYNLALAYNGGMNALIAGKLVASTYDYALRVSITYTALLAQRKPVKLVVHPVRFSLTPPMFHLSFQP